MSAITPQTELYLLKVPLEISDTNQLTFSNAESQHTYFNSLPKLSIGDNSFTYQRKDGVIRYGVPVDDLYGYNYVMYRNNNFSTKWFYAYITGMEWKSPNSTDISIKTDVWQTWQFDLNFKPVFVEREHVNDDTFGKHTLPEGLETGEFVRSTNGDECSYNNQFWLVFQVTELISNMDDAGTGTHRLYNGIYSGLYTVLIDNYTTADNLVKAYAEAGKAEAIIACFYIPRNTVTSYVTNSGCILGGVTSTIYFPNATTTANTIDTLRVARPTNIDGYVPHNNKLFTQEFCYMLGSNNAGAEAVYAFEDFRDSNGNVDSEATFLVRSSLSQGGSVRMIPSNDYKSPSATASYTSFNSVAKYGLTGGKLPICSWNSDYYTNWLTQNAVNIGIDAVNTTFNAIGSFATGDAASAVSTLINGIGGQVAKHYQAQITPNQAKGNVNCGDINFSEGLHLTVTAMTIRQEVARMIDGFFDMFGYKVSQVKIPNITGRRNWNYVKTIGCYIGGDVPQDDISEIKSLFDRGITFWHNPATFADYSQINDII